jgi:hypothetical protein
VNIKISSLNRLYQRKREGMRVASALPCIFAHLASWIVLPDGRIKQLNVINITTRFLTLSMVGCKIVRQRPPQALIASGNPVHCTSGGFCVRAQCLLLRSGGGEDENSKIYSSIFLAPFPFSFAPHRRRFAADVCRRQRRPRGSRRRTEWSGPIEVRGKGRKRRGSR